MRDDMLSVEQRVVIDEFRSRGISDYLSSAVVVELWDIMSDDFLAEFGLVRGELDCLD